MSREICPGCMKPQPNVGPWREPGQPERLCGGCKARFTLANPRIRERLRRDLSALTCAVLDVPSAVVEFPQFDGKLKS